MKELSNSKYLEVPAVILKYRKSFNFANHFLLFFLLICLSLFVASIVGYFQTRGVNNEMSISLIINAGFFGMIAALFFSLWRFYRQAILKSEVQVVNNSILYSSEHKEYSVYFEDIEKIDFVSIFGISRFLIKTKKHEVFSYSIWIEGVEKILDALYSFDKKLFENLSYDEMKKNMILSSYNICRMEYFFSKEALHKTLSHLMLAPALFLGVLLLKQGSIEKVSKFDYYLSSIQPFVFITFVTTLLYFVVSNFVITKRSLKNENVEKRNFLKEKIIFKKIYPWYASFMVVLFFGVIFFDVNLYGIATVNVSSVKVDVLKGERFWIDKKFNCVKCKYELKNNDIIVYRDKVKNEKHFAKVINLYPEFSRLPASAQQEIKKPLSIITTQSDQEIFIDFNQVVGKKL